MRLTVASCVYGGSGGGHRYIWWQLVTMALLGAEVVAVEILGFNHDFCIHYISFTLMQVAASAGTMMHMFQFFDASNSLHVRFDEASDSVPTPLARLAPAAAAAAAAHLTSQVLVGPFVLSGTLRDDSKYWQGLLFLGEDTTASASATTTLYSSHSGAGAGLLV